MVQRLTLKEALKQALEDDNKISLYEARVLRELILADGKVAAEEKRALEKALEEDQFDTAAYELLSDVLLRADIAGVHKKTK